MTRKEFRSRLFLRSCEPPRHAGAHRRRPWPIANLTTSTGLPGRPSRARKVIKRAQLRRMSIFGRILCRRRAAAGARKAAWNRHNACRGTRYRPRPWPLAAGPGPDPHVSPNQHTAAMNRGAGWSRSGRGGSPHTDETTYAHERSRFTTIAATARPCRPCRFRGGLRLLGPQASPC
jgi:hypothetical protein